MLYKSLYPDEIIYSPDLKLSGSMRTEIEQLYEKMYLEFTSKGINYVELLRLSLCELLLKIHRFYRQNHASPESAVIKYRHQLIPDCIQYLRENYSKKVTIEELSNNFFLSKSYLSSLFKRPPAPASWNICSISALNGPASFSPIPRSPSRRSAPRLAIRITAFFNKSFKKITGVTAHEYRKKNDDKTQKGASLSGSS